MQVQLANTQKELKQILEIQERNHVTNVPDALRRTQGYVTVKHDFELLQKMNAKAKQIVAIENDIVVGYALVMLKEFKTMIPVLEPMFEMFEHILYQKKVLSSYAYYVMGQICISDSHKGKGVFKAMYLKHKDVYSRDYEICLTEVSSRNIRSLRAHEKIGFKVIHTFKDKTDEWNILLWDWK